MDLVIARFFEDHSVHDGFPSFECITMPDAIVDDGYDGRDDELLLWCSSPWGDRCRWSVCRCSLIGSCIIRGVCLMVMWLLFLSIVSFF